MTVVRALLLAFVLLGVSGLSRAAIADPLTAWTAGPGATGDDTFDGSIDTPAMNATVQTGNFSVSGWFVDKQAQGWAGADGVELWLGTMDGGGRKLAAALFAQSRPDVAAAEGNPFWAASGFTAVVPGASLAPGPQTLSVYVHTPGKGWWYRQVQVTVAEPAAPTPIPVMSGGSPPVLVIEAPNQGTTFTTKQTFTVIGYALDPNAAPTQGSQGSGIDQVSVYADAPRESNGVYLGTADLAFSDPAAQKAYGDQFVDSGWRFDVKATGFHQGVHNLYIYAHSIATGKENLVTLGFSVVEAD